MSASAIRVGTDLVNVARLKRALSLAARLPGTVFTDVELCAARKLKGKRRGEFLAGRFAVKEAALKALRCGIEDKKYLRCVETIARKDGSPSMKLHGPVAAKAAALKFKRFAVSISHEGDLAIAFVVLMQEGKD